MNKTVWDIKTLKSFSPCPGGLEWYIEHCEKVKDTSTIVNMLIREKKLDWANWTIARALSHENQIRYAIYAAEQVLEIFEKKYPKDDRPRKAIEAAKTYLKKPNKINKAAADAAAYAAYAAYTAADAAAAYAAYSAYTAAAYAAYAAAYAAAAYAAYTAADAAADAAMKEKIIRYGIGLLEVTS